MSGLAGKTLRRWVRSGGSRIREVSAAVQAAGWVARGWNGWLKVLERHTRQRARRRRQRLGRLR